MSAGSIFQRERYRHRTSCSCWASRRRLVAQDLCSPRTIRLTRRPLDPQSWWLHICTRVARQSWSGSTPPYQLSSTSFDAWRFQWYRFDHIFQALSSQAQSAHHQIYQALPKDSIHQSPSGPQERHSASLKPSFAVTLVLGYYFIYFGSLVPQLLRIYPWRKRRSLHLVISEKWQVAWSLAAGSWMVGFCWGGDVSCWGPDFDLSLNWEVCCDWCHAFEPWWIRCCLHLRRLVSGRCLSSRLPGSALVVIWTSSPAFCLLVQTARPAAPSYCRILGAASCFNACFALTLRHGEVRRAAWKYHFSVDTGSCHFDLRPDLDVEVTPIHQAERLNLVQHPGLTRSPLDWSCIWVVQADSFPSTTASAESARSGPGQLLHCSSSLGGLTYVDLIYQN